MLHHYCPLLPTSLHGLITLCVLLALPGCKLAVEIQGDGAGNVTSTPKGLLCSTTESDCEISGLSAPIEILAMANEGSRFAGWQGLCEGDSPICAISSHGTVIARFEKSAPAEEPHCDTDAAKATCLTPTHSDEYYINQSILYFRTMESSASPFVMPRYSPRVARWEWPPWLLLTGYGRFNMIGTDIALKLNPTTYASIDCRAFDTQPFGRCHVVFDYSGELCPIYEEFTFNDQGEITFIEAWTDHPDWIPMAPDDYWAEASNVRRLANRVPGLGNPEGLIDPYASWMTEAAANDADLAEFVRRTKQPYALWLDELIDHANDVVGGCHPQGTLHR